MTKTTPESPYEHLIKFLRENIKYLYRELRRLEQCMERDPTNEESFKQRIGEFQNLVKERKCVLDELIAYRTKFDKYAFTLEATQQIINDLKKQNEQMTTENEKLKEENKKLKEENSKLKMELEALKNQ
ncbi:17579_t:CDS:2, partial [Racocetra fulgida]